MKKLHIFIALPLLFGGLNCKKTPPSIIKLDGSSTVFPISEAVSEEYQKKDPKIKITVGVSGTGGGFKKFCVGETDISDASRPIKQTEIELCAKNGVEYVELPVAYDGLAVVVHPQNTWAESITTQELKRIWSAESQAKVMLWSDVRTDWPKQPLHLFGAGVDSGTYDYFTEAINHKEHSSRGDYTSSEDDNVLVQGIAQDKNALGFFGYAYYENNRNKLKLVAVDDGRDENGKGPVLPSPETVQNGTYQPLSRPIFIYVSRKSLDKKFITEYVQFYLQNAARLVKEVGYVALPERAYVLAQKRLEAHKTGTVFQGKPTVGISVDQLLQ